MITTVKNICAVFIVCSILVSCDSKSEGGKSGSDSTKAAVNEGGKKDFATGMKTSYDGLSFDEVYLVDGNNKKLTNTEVDSTSKVMVVVTGVKGFAAENGMVHVGISVDVADENEKNIIKLDDILPDKKEGYAAKDAETLTATLTIGLPMRAGKKYFMQARFWDKKGKGEIKSEVELTIKK